MLKNNVNQLSLDYLFNDSYLNSGISFIVDKKNITEFPSTLKKILSEQENLNSNHQQFSINPNQYVNAINQLEEFLKEYRSALAIVSKDFDEQTTKSISDVPELMFQVARNLFNNFLMHPNLKELQSLPPTDCPIYGSTNCIENTFHKFQFLAYSQKQISNSNECIYLQFAIDLVSKVQNHKNISLYEQPLALFIEDACLLDKNIYFAKTNHILDILTQAKQLNTVWFENILYHFLLLSPSDNQEKSIASHYLSEDEMTNLYLKISNITPNKLIVTTEHQSPIMEHKINTLLKNALINSDDNISQCKAYLNFSISFNLDIVGHFQSLSPKQQVSYANKYFGAIGNIFESHFLKKHQLINILDIAATNQFSKTQNLSYKEILSSLVTLENDGSALLSCMDRKPISSKHLFHPIFNSLIPHMFVHDSKMHIVNSYSNSLVNGYESDYKNSVSILAKHIHQLSDKEQQLFLKQWDYSIDKLIERGSTNILHGKYMQISLTEALCKAELDNIRKDTVIESSFNKPKIKF